MTVWSVAALMAALAVVVAGRLSATTAATTSSDGTVASVLPVGPARVVLAAAAVLTATVWLAMSSGGRPVVVAALAVQLPLWLALAAVDARSFRLPASWTAALWVVAPVVVLALGMAEHDLPLLRLVGGAAVWGGLIGGLWVLTRGRGMGLGDVRLAPSLGVVCGWFGWGSVGVGLLAAFAVGAVYGVACRLTNRGSRVPFGPFLIAGAVIGVAAGQPLGALYLSTLGLG